MTYQSVDALQRALAATVFSNRQDVKKAAGRALGTIVELMTFYILREWGLLNRISIEKGLAEFANDEITHNVEFGIHPIIASKKLSIDFRPPLSSAKIIKNILKDNSFISCINSDLNSHKSNQLLSTPGVLRNSCTIAEKQQRNCCSKLNFRQY